MKKAVWFVLALTLAVAPGLSGCGGSTGAKRDRLAKDFLASVPDSLTDEQRKEIAALLETFWTRADMGEVFTEDIEEIEANLQRYADAGQIGSEELLKLMARVGYYTYRKDPRYNLPEQIVDHPTLNPDAALVIFGADSTGGRIQMYYRVPSADSTADSTAGSSADTTKAPSEKGRLKRKN